MANSRFRRYNWTLPIEPFGYWNRVDVTLTGRVNKSHFFPDRLIKRITNTNMAITHRFIKQSHARASVLYLCSLTIDNDELLDSLGWVCIEEKGEKRVHKAQNNNLNSTNLIKINLAMGRFVSRWPQSQLRLKKARFFYKSPPSSYSYYSTPKIWVSWRVFVIDSTGEARNSGLGVNARIIVLT